MKKLYFIPGSQDLYGEECLKQVAADCKEMVDFLNEQLAGTIAVELLPTVETSKICVSDMKAVMNDDDCVGVITWMHTFSPAKMWIKGLQLLHKPLLHLHTQANEKLPYDEIDMDFMNLNQAAHGDREYGFILARLGIAHEVVAGYYKNEKVISRIRRFAEVAKAISFSKNTSDLIADINGYMKVSDARNKSKEFAVSCKIDQIDFIHFANLLDTPQSRELADAGAFAMRQFSPSCTTMMYFKPGSMLLALTKE